MTLNGQPKFSSAATSGNDTVASVSSAPVEQFYETKLFRVVVARRALVRGHAIIERKEGDPHLYSFSTDAMDEFGYLLKKVSFWVMRLTGANGFTMFMHDGTSEVHDGMALQVHVVPRAADGQDFSGLATKMNTAEELDSTSIQQLVSELRDMMQLPQDVG